MLTHLSSFGQFFSDMWRHWMGKLTGPLSVVLALSPLVRPDFFSGDKGVIHNRWLWEITAAICYFLASKAAWNEQHEKLVKAETELDMGKPKFVINTGQIQTYLNPERTVTSFLVTAEIVNLGHQSACSGWQLEYKSGEFEKTVNCVLPVSKTYPWIIKGGGILMVELDDLLLAKTMRMIERGDRREGRLIFEIPGNRQLELNEGAASITLSCVDFQGTIWKGTFGKTYPSDDLQRYVYEEFIPPESKPLESVSCIPIPEIPLISSSYPETNTD